MSEVQTPEPGAEVTPEAAPTGPVELPADHPLVKAYNAQKAELKDLRPKANRLTELEQAQLTEAERLSNAAAEAKRDADQARAESLRYRVAATHGVSSDYFNLLGDGDETAITENAQKVASLLALGSENAQLKAEIEALKAGRTPAQIRPVADLKPGATPQADALPDTSYPASWLPRPRQSNKS